MTENGFSTFMFRLLLSVLCLLNTMQPTLHPPYHKEAKITCSGCGRTYEVGSTAASIQVEICANCHPFFSGKGTYIDTARRIDKFRKRQALAGRKA